VISRWTIFKCARTGGVGRDSAAKEATALCRIGWIKQTLLVHCTLKIRQDHTAFCDRVTTAGLVSNGFDTTQFICGEDDTAEGNTAADSAGACAGNSDWNSIAVGGFENLRDILDCLREDDAIRVTFANEARV